MRIVVINGQNHKGSTYRIGNILATYLTNRDQIQEVFLPKDMPKFCCGCTNCFMKDEKLCPHYEFMKPITEKIDEADVIIFTTPVYVYHTTGSMKALLDHYGYRWVVHRPDGKMFNKQAVCISTAAGGGMKSACRDIRDSLFFWGVPRVYSYGVAVRAISWADIQQEKKDKISKDMKKLAERIKRNEGKGKPSMRLKFYFNLARQLQKKSWNEIDVVYWKERGWDQQERPWKNKVK